MSDEIDRAIFDDPIIRATDPRRWEAAAERLGMERWGGPPRTGQVKCCLLAELGARCDCETLAEERKRAMQFPGPDATRAEIDEWLRQNGVLWETGERIEHEAPPVANGPSIVCNACGVVRLPLGKVLCRRCMGLIG